MDLPDTTNDVDAIDFKRLWLQEKRKAKLLKKHLFSSESKTATPKIPEPFYPEWKYSKTHVDVEFFDRNADSVAPGIFYKSVFLLDHDYQEHLWNWLRQLSENRHPENEAAALGKWTSLKHAGRRVALFDSRLAALPTPVLELVESVSDLFPETNLPNHVLINEYSTEQGILPHTDGPAYFDRTATISLGQGSVILKFTGAAPEHQVLLEGNGSLIVFEGTTYSDYKHGIDELRPGCSVEHTDETCLNAPAGMAVGRDLRISITIRCKK